MKIQLMNVQRQHETHAAEYEDLAVRARAHGLNDLANRYDEAATHWHNLYEEAEDEEMEW